MREVLLDHERGLEHRRGAGIVAQVGQGLVGHQLGLDDHPQGLVQGLDLVEDGGHGPLGEGDEPGRRDAHAASGRGPPAHLAHEGARP